MLIEKGLFMRPIVVKTEIPYRFIFEGKCQVIVGDGLRMGRPCCGVFRCTEPLQNNRHRFCKTHFDNHDICAIVATIYIDVFVAVAMGNLHQLPGMK